MLQGLGRFLLVAEMKEVYLSSRHLAVCDLFYYPEIIINLQTWTYGIVVFPFRRKQEEYSATLMSCLQRQFILCNFRIVARAEDWESRFVDSLLCSATDSPSGQRANYKTIEM